jgi:hypothetical protein
MSSLQYHVNDTVPGVAGTALAGGFTVMGFLSNSIPVLQAISLLVGIAVGIATFTYYWIKIRKGD